MLSDARYQQLQRELQSLAHAPTIVIGVGPESLPLARQVAAAVGTPFRLSICGPVFEPGRAVALGIVSGTDDLAFWNETLINDLGLPPSKVQELAAPARLQAIQDYHSAVLLGGRAVPGLLFNQNVLCIGGATYGPELRYELSLIRNRRLERLYFMSDNPQCNELITMSGIADEVLRLEHCH